MPLALPVPAQGAGWDTNFPLTPSTTPGTLITGDATPHVKGPWTTVVGGVNHDVFGFWLRVTVTAASNTRTDALLDIGIGSGADTPQVIVSNLVCGWRSAGSASDPALGLQLWLPIFISKGNPFGTDIKARLQALQPSKTARVLMAVDAGRSNLGAPMCSGMDAYGVDTASSMGTAHTPGDTGAESAWADIGAPLSRNYKGFLVIPQGTMDMTVMQSRGMHWEGGYSGIVLAEWMYQSATAEAMSGPFPAAPFMCKLPAGTQMQVRAESSGTPDPYDVAVYCLY